jgi:lipopolysaccharide/colanic/teichoic acid biosynthesis glycosyltransferase
VLIALRALEAYAFAAQAQPGAPPGASPLALVAALIGRLGADGHLRPRRRPGPLDLLATATAGPRQPAPATWWTIIARGRQQGRLTPNIVVVGATANAERLIEAALRTGEVNVLGVFDDRLDRAPANIGRAGAGRHRRPARPPHHALCRPRGDRGAVHGPGARAPAGREAGRPAQPPESFHRRRRPRRGRRRLGPDRGGGENELSGSATIARRAWVKRAQDLVVTCAGLLVAGPVMLLVAIAVKLDSPGPIFFRQRGTASTTRKSSSGSSARCATRPPTPRPRARSRADDDRVTKVGKFIRKTSLDELPQLFNVLRGEMSIVGPRPHAIGMKTGGVESAKLVAQYAHRHRMKPGLTGWAAIKGSRGPVDTPESVRVRVALDVEYIERQSFWLDLYIIVMTIPCLLGDRSAVR